MSVITVRLSPHVEVQLTDPHQIAATCQQLFGRSVSEAELAEFTGATPLVEWARGRLPDAQNQLRIEITSVFGRLSLEMFHPYYARQQRTIYKTRDAPQGNEILELHHDYWRMSAQSPQETGTRVFAGVVQAASQGGIDRITTLAAGNPQDLSDPAVRGDGWNGYYTWPRLGFNATIPPELQQQLPAHLQGATTLTELFFLPGVPGKSSGAEWWKAEGIGRPMTFELAAQSSSFKALSDYLTRKGIALPWRTP